MFAKQLYLGVAIISAAASGQAIAEAANPLHPSYYWGNTPEAQAINSDAKPYVDSRNPLSPAYAHVTVDPKWQPAAHSMGLGYRGSNNPLHPSFKR